MARIHAASRLGDYFVAFGLVTRKTLKSVNQNTAAGQMFGHALVKAGVCDLALCEEVAGIQKRFKKTAHSLAKQGKAIYLDEKSMIGDILVALGCTDSETIQEWLDFQQAKRARGEDAGRLGELLVNNGVCSASERDLAMKVQNWLRGLI